MNTPNEIISFLETLPKVEQLKVLPSGRTVKEIVFHLAAWKNEVTNVYTNYFNKDVEPWFIKEKNPTDFNKKIDLQYKDKNYQEAIDLLKESYKRRSLFIKKYGKEKLSEAGLDWMSEKVAEPHDIENLEQIKNQ